VIPGALGERAEARGAAGGVLSQAPQRLAIMSGSQSLAMTMETNVPR
jgi:hypothetical protein